MTQPMIGMSLTEVLGDNIAVSAHNESQQPFSASVVAAANPEAQVEQSIGVAPDAGPAAGLSSLVMGAKSKPLSPGG